MANIGNLGVKKPDITPPGVLREQSRLLALGNLQGRAKWWQVAAALLIMVVIVCLAAIAVVKVMWAAPSIDGTTYQAVFLDDGKVFFGKLRNTDGAYVRLEDAYYTKTASGDESADKTALVKVGSESYGPENSLQIARSKIIFWQNLRADSQVVGAIKVQSRN